MSFPRYPEYKESRVAWLAEVPAHWAVSAVKRYCEAITDGAHISPETEGGVFPFVSTRDVSGESIDFEGCLRTSASTFEYMARTGCCPRVGDVLFSKDGTIGRTVIVREDRKFAVASSLIIIRPNAGELDPSFLNHVCQSSVVVAQVDSFVKGAGLPRLSIENLLKVVVSFPSLDEQRSIAAFLDRETRKIDALVAEQQRLVELLKEKRQAVISHAVSKGLNSSAPMKPSGIEWLGDVPAHWDVKRLKYLGEAITGLTYDPAEVVDEEDGILVLRSSNVQSGRIAYDDNVYVSTTVPEELITKLGDILLCSRNGSRALIGKNAMIDVASSGRTFGAFMTVFRSVYNAYLTWIFNSSLFERQSGAFLTSTINQLTIGVLNDFEIPLPPAEERAGISQFLAARTASLDGLLNESQRAIELLQERRTALISAAVTGQIDVRGLAETKAA